jgi:hypothetical protein
MVMEVHTGARPGKPRALVIVMATLLAGTLALAWLQVRDSRALGPEQRIANTPLRVRPPRGWRLDPQNPGRLILPASDGPLRRSIHFQYLELNSFQPLEELLQTSEFTALGAAVDVRRARLGPYPAVQIQQLVPLALGRVRVQAEMITRFTCLPRGELIKVTYEPLVDMRPADSAIMDEVCESLRIEDASINAPAQTYFRAAGLELPADPNWTVVGPELADVPGLYIGGWAANGPTWALGVYRTWLATGRTPAALLRDFAADLWLRWDVDDVLHETQRSDGAQLATLRHPAPAHADSPLRAALVVAAGPTDAAIIYVYCDPNELPAAQQAAQAVADNLRFTPLPALPDVAAAEARGVKLAADLRAGGLAARWGREPLETTYRHTGRDEAVYVRREAVQRNPAAGYIGTQTRQRNNRQTEKLSWKIDGAAGAYEYTLALRAENTELRVREERKQPDGEVRRTVSGETPRPQVFTFQPGADFVPLPAEPIIRGWVARGPAEPTLYTTAQLFCTGAHSVLVRPLPADGQYPRVLVQSDYWPSGGIEAYDDARAETQYEVYPTGTYQRVK